MALFKNFSAAIGNIYAQVAPVNRELNWAYFMFNNRFRKYFRYAQMTSFIFETIIGFSAAIRNVYAQLVLMNRGLTSSYIMLIWMLLWDPLTYLFHWGTRTLHVNIMDYWPLSLTCSENQYGGEVDLSCSVSDILVGSPPRINNHMGSHKVYKLIQWITSYKFGLPRQYWHACEHWTYTTFHK